MLAETEPGEPKRDLFLTETKWFLCLNFTGP